MSQLSNQGFQNNQRHKQELRGRPFADIVYRKWLGDNIIIARYDIENGVHVLDQHYAIDCLITLPNGMVMTVQEKFISSKYAKYRSVTIEYYQNQHTKEQGDWFKLACQCYFVAYFNDNNDGFQFAYVLDMVAIATLTNRGDIIWVHNVNKDGRAQASFMYTNLDKLPNDCVLYKLTSKG